MLSQFPKKIVRFVKGKLSKKLQFRAQYSEN